ncbi:MAG: hypothetical protein WA373_09775 [Burkholderiales bacterium]
MRVSTLSASALVIGLLAGTPAQAQKVDQLSSITQSEFRLLSEDLGAVLSYRGQTPTTPLGTTGFDVGVAVTSSKIQNVAVLDKASSNNNASATIYLPTLRAHKGLPLGFDVGVMYASVPDSNMKYYGGEVRYAIVEGGVTSPAVGVRGSMTKLTGVDQLSVNTRGIDLSISKGFTVLTPYAGIGKVWVNSDPHGVPALNNEEFSLTKTFVGIGAQFILFNLNFEGDKTGDVKSYSIKVGMRF